jgi:hypothetical protein
VIAKKLVDAFVIRTRDFLQRLSNVYPDIRFTMEVKQKEVSWVSWWAEDKEVACCGILYEYTGNSCMCPSTLTRGLNTLSQKCVVPTFVQLARTVCDDDSLDMKRPSDVDTTAMRSCMLCDKGL